MKYSGWDRSFGIVFSLLMVSAFFSHVHVWAAPLSNSVTFTVWSEHHNRIVGDYDRGLRCGDQNHFKGTHAKNGVFINPQGHGGTGHYSHTLMYTWGDGYEFKGKVKHPVDETRHWPNIAPFYIRLPELRDGVPFVEQEFVLRTKDWGGNKFEKRYKFRVSRPVILTPSIDTDTCMDIRPAELVEVGPTSNGSSLNSKLEITQGILETKIKSKGWQAGAFLTPMVGYDGFLMSLFSLNYSYFQQTSRQFSQSKSITQTYEVPPGDFDLLYVQGTRYRSFYDMEAVGPCGEIQKTAQIGIEKWATAFHTYTLNPQTLEMPKISSVGAPLITQCKDDGLVNLEDPVVAEAAAREALPPQGGEEDSTQQQDITVFEFPDIGGRHFDE